MARVGPEVAPAPCGTRSRHRPGQRIAAPGGRRRDQGRDRCDYFERAMLLWPRLDRTKLRRCRDDPQRIAEVVVRRTAQPLDAILAMLTRQLPVSVTGSEEGAAFGPAGPAPVALRVIREPEAIDIGELVLA